MSKLVTFKQPHRDGWFIGCWERGPDGPVFLWWRPVNWLFDLPTFLIDRYRAWRDFGHARSWFLPLSLRQKYGLHEIEKHPKRYDEFMETYADGPKAYPRSERDGS